MDKINLFIISFNRLSFLKQQLEVLLREPRIKITILDNRSTYLPLLQFYDNIANKVPIIVQNENYGHTVPWKKGWTQTIAKNEPYFVTDNDIIPNKDSWFDFLFEGMDKFPQVNKVGLGLYTGDIPINIPYRNEIIKHEEQYIHRKELKDICFVEMPVDTTLALYRGGYHDYSIWGTHSNTYQAEFGCKAIRTTYPWTAKHLGWYMTMQDLASEENQFYLNSFKPQSTHWSAWQQKLTQRQRK